MTPSAYMRRLLAIIAALVACLAPSMALAADGGGGLDSTGKTTTLVDNPSYESVWYDNTVDANTNPVAGTTLDSNWAYWIGQRLYGHHGITQIGNNTSEDIEGAVKNSMSKALQRAKARAIANGADSRTTESHIVGMWYAYDPQGRIYWPCGLMNQTSASLMRHFRFANNTELPYLANSSQLIDQWREDVNAYSGTTFRMAFFAVTNADFNPPPTKKAADTVAYVGKTETYKIHQQLNQNWYKSLSFSDDLDTVYDAGKTTFKVTYTDRNGNKSDQTSRFTKSVSGQMVTVTGTGSKDNYFAGGTWTCELTCPLTSNTLSEHKMVNDPSSPYNGYYEIDNSATTPSGTTDSVPVYTPGFYIEVEKTSYDSENIPADFDENRYGHAVYKLYTDEAKTTLAKTVDGRDAIFDTTADDGTDTLKYFLPGTYWMYEETAPTGYTIDPEPIKVTVDGDPAKVSYETKGHHKVSFVKGDDGLKVKVEQGNTPIMAGVRVRKVDRDLWKLRNLGLSATGSSTDSNDYDPTVPEGNAAFAGTTYAIYNTSGSDVVIHGHRIKSTTLDEVRSKTPAELKAGALSDCRVTDIGDGGIIKADATGIAHTRDTSALVWGTYTIAEIDAPEGYVNDSQAVEFKVGDDDNGTWIDLTSYGPGTSAQSEPE